MQRIENLILRLKFEGEPYSPYKYDEAVIVTLEDTLGISFPEDLRWYLLHIGWRKINFGEACLLVQKGAYLYNLEFRGVDHQTFAPSRIKDGRFFFGEVSGELNPGVYAKLFIDSTGVYVMFKDDVVVKLADSFTDFFALLKSKDEQARIAKPHNQALLDSIIADYIASGAYRRTLATSAEALMQQFFTDQPNVVIDSIQNILYTMRDGFRIESAEDFLHRAKLYQETSRNPYWFPQHLERKELQIGAATEIPYASHYYRIPVTSIVGQESNLQETFLLYKDPTTAQWSLLRRDNATIPEVKIKKLGTFTFDSTYKWSIKTKVTPKWSELKATIHIDGEEDALTSTRITFVKSILDNADFKPILEAECRRIMGLAPDANVWSHLGKKLSVYVKSDDTFHIHVETDWDEEHGITLRVKQWELTH
jgi:hypothetical protein